MKFRLSLLVLFVLGITALAWSRNATDFSLSDSDGKQVSLSQFRGKYVLLEFMLTTCPHCQAASKVLEKVQLEYPDQLQVLAISTGPQGVVALTDFKRDFGVTYPVLQGTMPVMMNYLGISPLHPNFHVPVFFLVGPDGSVLQERNSEHPQDKDFYANADENLEAMIRNAIPAKKATKAAPAHKKSSRTGARRKAEPAKTTLR